MNKSEFFSYFSNLINTADQLKSVIAILTIAILYFFAWSRTGSTHFILARIWFLLGGGIKFHQETLNKRWQELKDLESFRFKTGINITSNDSLIKLLDWSKYHSISLDHLIKSRNWLNFEKLEITTPNWKAWTRALYIILTIYILSAAASLTLIVSPSALLTHKVNNNSYWVSQERAHPSTNWSWTLNSKQCGNQEDITSLQKNTNLVKIDADLLCRLLTEKEGSQFIESTIIEQKILGTVLFAIFTAILLAFGLEISKASIARRISSRITTIPDQNQTIQKQLE